LERAPRGEKLPKDCPTAEVLLEAKAAALHLGRYQSSLSKLSTKREGEAGEKKRRQSDWLANQMDRKVIDRQVIDRQVIDRQVIDRQVIDRQVIDRQVIDRQTDRSRQGR
jgi:hypothetical protein